VGNLMLHVHQLLAISRIVQSYLGQWITRSTKVTHRPSRETIQTRRRKRLAIKPELYEDKTSGFPSTGPSCFCFLYYQGYTFKYYYVVHPHTQYRGTMLQQGFWCWDILINTPSRELYRI